MMTYYKGWSIYCKTKEYKEEKDAQRQLQKKQMRDLKKKMRAAAAASKNKLYKEYLDNDWQVTQLEEEEQREQELQLQFSLSLFSASI